MTRSPETADPVPQAPPTLAARVRELAPGTSWEAARALCRNGRVWVDGRPALDPAWRPAADSTVEVLAPAAARERLAAATAAGNRGSQPEHSREQGRGGAASRDDQVVVHLDADVVVVRKPAGVLTVPFDRGDRDTLLALTRVAVRRIEARGAGGRPGNPTLRAVQRLDRDTSGLLVFARGVAAQRALQQQLARREVHRRYEALAHGVVADGTLESWLVADRGDGLRGSWRGGDDTRADARQGPPNPSARHAVTHVRTLTALRGATHIACELDTGRQHQIRIHLAEAGHPLVGETVYIRDYAGPRIAAPRPMLHAAVLAFHHPRDGRPLRFEEPPPADFAELLGRLRRRVKPGTGPGGI